MVYYNAGFLFAAAAIGWHNAALIKVIEAIWEHSDITKNRMELILQSGVIEPSQRKRTQ